MKLKLPEGAFRAYLFDCDGTIADSMPLHYNAWKAVLADWNCDYPEEVFYSWEGKPVRNIIADLNMMNGLKMPVEDVAMRKESLYLAQLPQLKAIPEVLECIEAEHGRIPFAVVSCSSSRGEISVNSPLGWSAGSTRDSVVGSLSVLGLLDKFDIIVSADDYKHGKPAPDGYLLAAARLGVAPADCLVFEDTEMGVEAATAAGMASVKVLTSLERRLANQ